MILTEYFAFQSDFSVLADWRFLLRRKNKIDYYVFVVGFLEFIRFCLILETHEKWVFDMKMTPVIVRFFDQSEAEKIPKKIKVN